MKKEMRLLRQIGVFALVAQQFSSVVVSGALDLKCIRREMNGNIWLEC
jgi:hypothetical protein